MEWGKQKSMLFLAISLGKVASWPFSVRTFSRFGDSRGRRGMKRPGMPICYVTLRCVCTDFKKVFPLFVSRRRSAEIKWRRAWAVTERLKRLYFSFSGRKNAKVAHISIYIYRPTCGWKTPKSNIDPFFTVNSSKKWGRRTLLNYEKIRWKKKVRGDVWSFGWGFFFAKEICDACDIKVYVMNRIERSLSLKLF